MHKWCQSSDQEPRTAGSSQRSSSRSARTSRRSCCCICCCQSPIEYCRRRHWPRKRYAWPCPPPLRLDCCPPLLSAQPMGVSAAASKSQPVQRPQGRACRRLRGACATDWNGNESYFGSFSWIISFSHSFRKFCPALQRKWLSPRKIVRIVAASAKATARQGTAKSAGRGWLGYHG